EASRQIAAGLPRVSHKNFLHIFERGSSEVSARDRKRYPALTRFRIGHVDHAVLSELGMDRDEMKRIVSLARSRSRPDGSRRKNAVADDPQFSVPLRYEKSMRINESHAPRMKQARSHCGHPNLSTLHIEHAWTGVARRGRGLPAVNRQIQDHGRQSA